MKIELSKDKTAIYIDGNYKSFPSKIAQTLEFPSGVAVLTVSDPKGRNVFFLDLQGKLMWQIEEMDFPSPSFYSQLSQEGPNLEAYSFISYMCAVDITTGKIIDSYSYR